MDNKTNTQITNKKEYCVRVYEKQVLLKVAYVFVQATSEEEAKEEVRKAFIPYANEELWKQIAQKLDKVKWLPTEMGDKGVL